MTVETIIKPRKNALTFCSPGDFLDEALDAMVSSGESAIVVIESNNALVGILTDDDIIRAVQKRGSTGHSINHEHVFDWMSVDVITADADVTLKTALGLMTLHGIRHLVVMDKNKPVAVIGVSDVLSALHTKDETHVQHLRGLITTPRARTTTTHDMFN